MHNDMNAGDEANEELMKERFLLRGELILDSAWMSYQHLALWRRRDPPPKFSDSDKLIEQKLDKWLEQGNFDRLEKDCI